MARGGRVHVALCFSRSFAIRKRISRAKTNRKCFLRRRTFVEICWTPRRIAVIYDFGRSSRWARRSPLESSPMFIFRASESGETSARQVELSRGTCKHIILSINWISCVPSENSLSFLPFLIFIATFPILFRAGIVGLDCAFRIYFPPFFPCKY